MIEHFYNTLEGENWFDYENVYRDAVNSAKDGAVFVEVGSWKGKSAAFMAVEIINSGKKIQFYSIDDWSLGGTKEEFYKNIEPVKEYIGVIDSISWEAARIFADNSIDFCFLDGAHDYDGVKKDISAFMPKVKIGGIMAGHDYTPAMDADNQVYFAVNEMIGAKNISLINNVWLYERNI